MPKQTSSQLNQKAAGYMLAAANASKNEQKSKNSSTKNNTKTTITKTTITKTTVKKK